MESVAFDILGEREAPVRWLLTVEHASKAVPAPLHIHAADAAILDTHWGHDIGAEPVAAELCRLLPALAVVARFSRLVIDANRDPHDATAIRCHAEGVTLSFNQPFADPALEWAQTAMARAEHTRRFTGLHAPYHDAIDAEVAAQIAHAERRAPLRILSLHTFTPVLGAGDRWMEVGVLYDDHEPEALALARGLEAAGLRTALNEPYSGRQGLIYSPQRHGRRFDVPYLELELRQDLLADAAGCARVAQQVAAALAHFAGPGLA